MAQVVHQIYQAEGEHLHLTLPHYLAGKKLEVIVRLAEEETQDNAFLIAAGDTLAKEWLNEEEDQAWKQL